MTKLLLDTMKKSAAESKREGRIVNVSSRAHRSSYPEGIRFDKINDKSRYYKNHDMFIDNAKLSFIFIILRSSSVTMAD